MSVREFSRSNSRLYAVLIELPASSNRWKLIVKFANQTTVSERCLLQNVTASGLHMGVHRESICYAK